MSYKIKLNDLEVAAGDICEVHDGFPATASELAGEAPPFATLTFDSNLEVNLSPGTHTTVALRLKRGAKVYARSNNIEISSLSDSATNNFHVSPITQIISKTRLLGFIPATPLTIRTMTVTSLSVDVTTDKILLSGAASVNGPGVLDFTITFTYDFTLVESVVPLWTSSSESAYLTVKKVDFNVSGKNIVQDFILLLLKGTLRERLESRLNKDLNDTIRSNLAPLGDVEATICSTAIDSNGLTLDVNLWSRESICPFAALSSGAHAAKNKPLSPRAPAELSRIRALRDKVIAPIPRGSEYLRLYERHHAEIALILRSDPKSSAAFEAAVQRFFVENPLETEDPRLSTETWALTREVLQSVQERASPALRQTLDDLLSQLGAGTPEASLRDRLRG